MASRSRFESCPAERWCCGVEASQPTNSAPFDTLAAVGFVVLVKPEWKKLPVGNPKTAPAGRYADEALQAKKGVIEPKDRLILCVNVRQVLDEVIRGGVEAFDGPFKTGPKRSYLNRALKWPTHPDISPAGCPHTLSS